VPLEVELDLEDLLPKPKVFLILVPNDFLGGLEEEDDLPHDELEEDLGLDERDVPNDWVG